MARVCSEIPPDFWGLSLDEVRKAVGRLARVTNEEYKRNGMTEEFELVDLGKFMIRAASLKKLRKAMFWIGEARRKRGLSGSVKYTVVTR